MACMTACWLWFRFWTLKRHLLLLIPITGLKTPLQLTTEHFRLRILYKLQSSWKATLVKSTLCSHTRWHSIITFCSPMHSIHTLLFTRCSHILMNELWYHTPIITSQLYCMESSSVFNGIVLYCIHECKLYTSEAIVSSLAFLRLIHDFYVYTVYTTQHFWVLNLRKLFHEY